MGRAKSGERAEFFQAAWCEVMELIRAYDVVVVTNFQPATRRGIWVLNTQVFEQGTQLDGRPVVAYQSEYPNSMAESFQAHLYGHAHRVQAMLDSWALDREQARRRAD